MNAEPVQSSEKTWRFIRELKAPYHASVRLWKKTPPAEAARLDRGCRLDPHFPDAGGLLQTAYADFRYFLLKSRLRTSDSFRITTGLTVTKIPETHRIEVNGRECRILAGDAEGIRRGLVFVEDQLLRNGGPFLAVGVTERRPVIRTRISRCFFGPIHRPPKNRDELADNVNYYPDEYLNRLAHEGVNGLWLTVHFGEICPQSVIPEYGRCAGRRLAKLRLTVKRCARYGIKIYLFTNEPVPLDMDSPVARAHPELLGHPCGVRRRYFCTSNPAARAYLEEAMRNLFAAVPGLGGLINISIGEGGSHCYSGNVENIRCPRCANRKPYEVLNETLAAMERGMHASSPSSELISWPYTQYYNWGDKLTVDSAGRLPPGVILQHNFESSAEAEQCGRKHKILDYWLSFIGPSRVFADCARAAAENGNRMFAKLQVGCSHEAATVPFVPVPGHLFRKYKAMHALGVSGVMQCWYFGNYPGLMTRAAGELAFAPLARTEDEFLLQLARRDWGPYAPRVVKAWKWFQRGYSHFPMNHMFGWYGPMHDAPVWPLHLEPVDRRIAPSWLIASQETGKPIPPSGDRIGECFGYSHTLPEILKLCGEITRNWSRGVAELKNILPHHAASRERRLDIGVATALGIQFESGFNMLQFYALREELPYKSRREQLKMLGRMKAIVRRELVLDAELLGLCRADSRLGFHSEAEGYKYFPAKIKSRMKQLNALLNGDFPRIRARIEKGLPLWPAYTGRAPAGEIYRCRLVAAPPPLDGRPAGSPWDTLPEVELPVARAQWSGTENEEPCADETFGMRTTWKACHDGKALYLAISCFSAEDSGALCEKMGPVTGDGVQVCIEPRRLWPQVKYALEPGGTHGFCGRSPAVYTFRRADWIVSIRAGKGEWTATLGIPFSSIRDPVEFERPLRIDIQRWVRREKGLAIRRWIEPHPLECGLGYGTDNPADLGWLVFE